MQKLNNLISIDELSDLLADNILSDSMLQKKQISLKCKIFMLAWQRANSFPRNLEKSKSLIIDGIKYKLLIKFIKENMYEKYGFAVDDILNEFYKIENLINDKEL